MTIASKTLQKKFQLQARGFTVIELMVTVAIVVLVTGLIMIQYSSFNNSVLLRNQAYLAAFDVREAQSLAVSVKGQGAEFREEYGLHFDIANPSSYILFQDNTINGNQVPARYHSGNNDEKIGQPYRVDPRFIIKNLCATNSSSRTCLFDDPKTTDETISADLQTLTVSFRRPDFEASFYNPSKANIQSGEIIFGTENGATERKVVIYKTGQVSVD